MIDVTLTADDLAWAINVGSTQLVDSIRRHRNPGRPRPWAERIEHDVLGCLAEVAFMRSRGDTSWPTGPFNFHVQPDCGDRYEIRWTRHRTGHLIIRPGDPIIDRVYVLVVGTGPVFHIVGWISGYDAARPEWLRPDGSWWVPQSALRPAERTTP